MRSQQRYELAPFRLFELLGVPVSQNRAYRIPDWRGLISGYESPSVTNRLLAKVAYVAIWPRPSLTHNLRSTPVSRLSVSRGRLSTPVPLPDSCGAVQQKCGSLDRFVSATSQLALARNNPNIRRTARAQIETKATVRAHRECANSPNLNGAPPLHKLFCIRYSARGNGRR